MSKKSVGVVVVFIVFSMVLAACSTKEYPYELENIDSYKDLIGSFTDVTGYQLDNKVVYAVDLTINEIWL